MGMKKHQISFLIFHYFSIFCGGKEPALPYDSFIKNLLLQNNDLLVSIVKKTILDICLLFFFEFIMNQIVYQYRVFVNINRFEDKKS